MTKKERDELRLRFALALVAGHGGSQFEHPHEREQHAKQVFRLAEALVAEATRSEKP